MSETLSCISPIDGQILAERACASTEEIIHDFGGARRAQAEWRQVPLSERAAICSSAVDAMLSMADEIVPELARQMGRPVRFGQGELNGFEERARHMIAIADEALDDLVPEPKSGFSRKIKREPLGVVLTIAPWNYPYLTAVNSIVPALMAGNAVILKPARQTLLTGDRFVKAFADAGLPDDLFRSMLMSHEQTAGIVRSRLADMVCFTGSVGGGAAIEQAAAGQFLRLGLELGGKDPAYVRADADIDFAIENLVDGAFFNSGQSCCAVERIYVHRDIHDRFLAGFVDCAKSYVLGDPLDPETTLGPMVNAQAAAYVRDQLRDAITKGAISHLDESHFPLSKEGTPYLAPHVLSGVDHGMSVMTDESFGPVIGIMAVDSDDEAVALMNDSPFGLTASLWTGDEEAAYRIGSQVETGTVFMNRCDYLDPALAWTGIKNSGRGSTLSQVGYEQLTRAKSFHMRTEIPA